MSIAQSHLAFQAVGDVAVVRFMDKSILNETVIQDIGCELFAIVDEGGWKKIILDFSNVDFVNSSTLGMVFKMGKKAKDAKSKLRLCSVNPAIYDVFKITSMDKFLDVKPTLADALKGI